MKVEIYTCTDGKGPNTDENARTVLISKIDFGYQSTTFFPDDPFKGELRAHFDPLGFVPGSWNVEGYGHIHSDKSWLRSFKAGLRDLGISIKGAQDVKYAELDRQGESYVTLDVGPVFYASFKRVAKKMKDEAYENSFTLLKDL